MTDKAREEFEAWYIDRANKATGMRMSLEDIKAKRGDSGDYAAYGYMHGCWIGWQASRDEQSETAWRIIDRKGKRFTVYNADLAAAIAAEGLTVIPMCDVPPFGWECSREPWHKGPCSASEVRP